MTKRYTSLLAVALSLAACDGDREAAARMFAEQADRCLLAVRDHGARFEASRECLPLRSLSMAYINAGGGREESPTRHRLLYEQGRASAWAALAISRSGDPSLSLW